MHSSNNDERYWLAINGPSCAVSPLPLRNPLLTPTPVQMLGFPTHGEAARAQRICLQAPMDEVVRFLESLRPDVKSGRIRVVQPKHPQPPTADNRAIWTESAEAHQAIQRVHIKTTSN